MSAILGGLGAAVAWAVSTLCASRSARMIGAPSAVAWLALVGLVVLVPAIAAGGVPAHLDAPSAGWLALSGAGNVAGLLVAYLAYRVGDVALIAPVIATEGAIAALIAFAAGESVTPAQALVLVVIAAGVTLAARAVEPARSAHQLHPRRAVLLAALAAISFGTGLYATGHVSGRLPLAWVVLPPRALATLFVAAPLALAGGLRLTRRAAPLVAVSGVCEVLGFASYTLGARHDLAVAAVLSAQFAAVSAVAAYLLFGERLARVQVAGVVLVLAGVSALSGLRA